LDSLNGFAYGEILLSTTSSGLNWIKTSDSTIDMFVSDVYFLNSNTGFIISGTSSFVLKKTTNGGLNWNDLHTERHLLFQVNFIDENTGFVTSATHHPPSLPLYEVIKTTNGGTSWVKILDLPAQALSILVNGLDTLLISSRNKIYISVNRGLSWSLRTLPVDNHFFLFKGCNFQNLFCYALYDLPTHAYLSSNNGYSWQQFWWNNSRILRGYYVNNSSVYLVSYVNSLYSNSIHKSENSGQNWNLQDIFPYIFDIQMINPNTGYIVGWNGLILKTTNGGNPIGIESSSNEIPSIFSLYQNYPNPFNPTTRIKFDIPQTSFTKLVVYDLLGREIKILVNEELKSGTYEAEWDASDFSSGIYFYKLSTNEFVETKKMVLIK
jgi:photosystem II stability/assembly factor-like uncharacterized protein